MLKKESRKNLFYITIFVYGVRFVNGKRYWIYEYDYLFTTIGKLFIYYYR